jgi:hypothetical protein
MQNDLDISQELGQMRCHLQIYLLELALNRGLQVKHARLVRVHQLGRNSFAVLNLLR